LIKKILVCAIWSLLIMVGVWGASSGPQNINVSVTVVGSIFSLDLQDSSGYPFSGQLNLGTFEPGGEANFPPDAVLVAACKSNRLTQWELQIEGTQLTDEASGRTMAEDSLQVRGYDALRTGSDRLPGSLVTVARPIKTDPATMYTSNSEGDAGFNNGYGSYVPVGFGVKVPEAQMPGTYLSRVTLIMTE
jgi:hypothetical protein